MDNDLNKNSKKTALVISLKILFFCGVIAGAIFLWMIGLLVIGLGSVNPVSMNIFWTLLLLSLLIFIYSLLFRKARKIWKWAGSSALLCLLVLCLIPAYRWLRGEFPGQQDHGDHQHNGCKEEATTVKTLV